MVRRFLNKRKIKKLNHDINPDEIFLDSENLPEFDRSQFEGRIEKPIGKSAVITFGLIFFLVISLYASKAFSLQINQGEKYLELSQNNRLRHTLIFADRGNIYDRNEVPLAWNIPKTDESEYNLRKYTDTPGFANILGYIKYPQKDKAGFYYEEDFVGFAGIEKFYEDIIKGVNGLQIIETNALQEVVEQSVIRPPQHGDSITLSIDSEIQAALYNSISEIAKEVNFNGGAGVIMDVTNGEIIALTSYPEFDPNVITDGSDKDAISSYFNNPKNPFLNRIINGLYTPGSIVKPYMALAALQEGVVTPTTEILSTGQIVIPNPYSPSNPSIFTDWKAHGYVNVKDALAVSSNVYFYEVGGGFENQKGIGISNIEKYMRLFGFGEEVGGKLFEGESGTIPNPEWKAENFDGDPWRIGDTYFTSIGQYGFQATPLQVIRAVSAVANSGKLFNPVLVKGESSNLIKEITEIDKKNFEIVRAGMREGVLFGTAKGLNVDYVNVAAKTGTAELGVSKERVNSWVTGFWPYENPKYAFVIVMEKGGRHNLIGGVAVMRRLLDWMYWHKAEYFE